MVVPSKNSWKTAKTFITGLNKKCLLMKKFKIFSGLRFCIQSSKVLSNKPGNKVWNFSCGQQTLKLGSHWGFLRSKVCLSKQLGHKNIVHADVQPCWNRCFYVPASFSDTMLPAKSPSVNPPIWCSFLILVSVSLSWNCLEFF